MVLTTGRVRTATGTAVIAALFLVLLFGSPMYVDWAAHHASNNSALGFFLRQLAWPSWTFDADVPVRDLLARDLRAILIIAFTALFVTLVAGSQLARARGSLSQFLAGWAGYMFAGAFAGFVAGLVVAGGLLTGFLWAAAGVVYGLFTGWVIGFATLGARR